MDASKLEVGDVYDRACGDPLCMSGTHREVVLAASGSRLTVARESNPYRTIEVEVRGTEMWIVNGPQLELADIYKGEGTASVAEYEEYEKLVQIALEHEMDELVFDLANETNKKTVMRALALAMEPRIDKKSGSVYAALKDTGIEPTEACVVTVVALLNSANTNGQLASVAGLLGSLLGGGLE